MTSLLLLFASTFANAASNTLVSRARNSGSLAFGAAASVLSNGVWLIVLRQVVHQLDSVPAMAAYVAGAVCGSVGMHWLSMRHIEHRIPTAVPTQKEP